MKKSPTTTIKSQKSKVSSRSTSSYSSSNSKLSTKPLVDNPNNTVPAVAAALILIALVSFWIYRSYYRSRKSNSSRLDKRNKSRSSEKESILNLQKQKTMSVVGIDFGNLNTVIAVARNRGIDVICNEVSNRATPSLVSYGSKQRYLGEAAKTQEISNFKNTVSSLKRCIGRPFNDSDIQGLEKNFINAKLVESEAGECGAEIGYLDTPTNFSFTQLCAAYFTNIKSITQAEIKIPVNDCVISCPGWFSDRQRRAIVDAAEIAGLNPLRVMNDLTAAALGYGITKLDLPDPTADPNAKPRNVVFVDLGHSSYQVSVVSFVKGKLAVKSTAYDPNLGGRNFDEVLVNHFVEEFKGKYKIDVASNGKALHRLRMAVEKVKKILSANAVTMLNVECIMDDKDVSANVDRAMFEELAQPLLARLAGPLEAALKDSGIAKEDITCVELVGGSTRIPAVKEALAKFFGGNAEQNKLSTTLNQDEAIARGCALQCAIISPVFRVRDFNIQDWNGFSVSLSWDPKLCPPPKEGETVESTLQPFPIGGAIPSTKLLTFYRNIDPNTTATTSFEIQAAYDASNLTERNLRPGVGLHIGKWRVEGIKPIPFASEKDNGSSNSALFKIKAKLTSSGIVNLESAYQVEETVVVEEVKPAATDAAKKEGTAPAAEKKAEEGAAPMETDESASSSNADVSSATNSTEDVAMEEKTNTTDAAPKTKTKRTQKRHELVVVPLTHSLPRPTIAQWKEAEGKMLASDTLVVATANARNALEEYVYETRGKIEEGGEWHVFIDEATREKFMAMLREMEDWLYTEEGEESTKSVYTGKLDELKKLGDPVFMRYRESEERPRAEKAFREYVNAVIVSVTAGDDRYDHIEKADMEKVTKECETKLNWLNDHIAKQNDRKPFEALAVTAERILREREVLFALVNPILSRPKPAPVPEEPKKEGEEEKPAAGEGKEESAPMDTDDKKPASEMDID